MKVRQRYRCEYEEVCVRYIFNKIGLIVEMIEVDCDSDQEKDELVLPAIEVTDAMFEKIINNPKLK